MFPFSSWQKNNLQIADPFAASEIREIRILKECKKGKGESLLLNDHSPDAIQQIKKNLKQNKVNEKHLQEDN
ncbi:MAG: hypothetical protein AABX82_05660 [Nanoarchaeota archaeon]